MESEDRINILMVDDSPTNLLALETILQAPDRNLVRGRQKSRNIPIIFLTADSTGGRHLSRGYSLGAVDYIVKPIEPDVLRSKVAVFVELFKKTQEIQRQAELLQEKNLELENANLARLAMLIELGHELAGEHEPSEVLKNFCRSARRIVEAQEAAVGLLNTDGRTLRYFFRCGPDGDNSTRGK